MKSLKSIVAASTVGTMLLLSGSASANLVVDGGFEQGPVSGPFQTYNAVSAMGGWTVSAGSVDLIGGYWQPAGGAQSVDAAGFFQNGTIEQTITTTPNSVYELSFDLSGNPDGPPTIKTVRVYFGTSFQDFSFDTTGIDHSNMHWTLQTWDFTASGSSTVLAFQDISGGVGSGTAYGAALDNVSLNAVPEPTTIIAGALLLLPFGPSTLRILRRHRKQAA